MNAVSVVDKQAFAPVAQTHQQPPPQATRRSYLDYDPKLDEYLKSVKKISEKMKEIKEATTIEERSKLFMELKETVHSLFFTWYTKTTGFRGSSTFLRNGYNMIIEGITEKLACLDPTKSADINIAEVVVQLYIEGLLLSRILQSHGNKMNAEHEFLMSLEMAIVKAHGAEEMKAIMVSEQRQSFLGRMQGKISAFAGKGKKDGQVK